MPRYKLGDVLTAPEMTEYLIRHKVRNAWGIMDEEEIKQTISYAGDYWKLETIDISEFSHIADPDFPNRSRKAHPVVQYADSRGERYCDVLDGLHRIGMARARGETTMLAWVAYLETAPESNGQPSAAEPQGRSAELRFDPKRVRRRRGKPAASRRPERR